MYSWCGMAIGEEDRREKEEEKSKKRKTIKTHYGVFTHVMQHCPKAN
jgi:hypothetical protein